MSCDVIISGTPLVFGNAVLGRKSIASHDGCLLLINPQTIGQRHAIGRTHQGEQARGTSKDDLAEL